MSDIKKVDEEKSEEVKVSSVKVNGEEKNTFSSTDADATGRIRIDITLEK